MFRALPLAALLLSMCVCTGCMMPNHDQQIQANEAYLKREGIVALKVGDSAPPLTGATDGSGEAAQLPAMLAAHKTGVLLFFFPAVDTPNSNLNLQDWDKRRAALEAEGLGIYAVCPASAAGAASYAQELGITLPLLADPEGTVAQAYGCLPPGGQYPQRTTVGIGPAGDITFYHRGTQDQAAVLKGFGLAKPAK
jgi:peroxiredoxin Q/BCP